MAPACARPRLVSTRTGAHEGLRRDGTWDDRNRCKLLLPLSIRLYGPPSQPSRVRAGPT